MTNINRQKKNNNTQLEIKLSRRVVNVFLRVWLGSFAEYKYYSTRSHVEQWKVPYCPVKQIIKLQIMI